MHTCFKRHQ